jgi:hypothetical protein
MSLDSIGTIAAVIVTMLTGIHAPPYSGRRHHWLAVSFNHTNGCTLSGMNTFPKQGQQIQVAQGSRAINVTVLKAFPEANEIVGRMMGLPSKAEDPRGSFIVARREFDRWIFKHTLTPEQAGQPPLTAEQRAALAAARPPEQLNAV